MRNCYVPGTRGYKSEHSRDGPCPQRAHSLSGETAKYCGCVDGVTWRHVAQTSGSACMCACACARVHARRAVVAEEAMLKLEG